MSTALDDPNDRLRTVAYAYFEHNVERGMSARLLRRLTRRTTSSFVPPDARARRVGDEPAVQTALTAAVMRGQDLYRSAVIEALGDYHAAYALTPIMTVAKLDGPLQEDAILAIGKIGEKRALETLQGLQKTGSRVRQPAVAAAICLLGFNCESHQRFIVDTMNFAIANEGFQELLRAASRALGTLAASGRQDAAGILLDVGIPTGIQTARDRAGVRWRRAAQHAADDQAAGVAHGSPRRRSSSATRSTCWRTTRELFRLMQRTCWRAPVGSPDHQVADALIQALSSKRFTFAVRSAVRSSQFAVHGSRFTVHGSDEP
jgi:hypothetical protein